MSLESIIRPWAVSSTISTCSILSNSEFPRRKQSIWIRLYASLWRLLIRFVIFTVVSRVQTEFSCVFSFLIQALMDSGLDYRGSHTGVYFSQLLTSTGELV